MSMSCEVVLRWDSTPEQRRALGAALWRWCSQAAGAADIYQYLDNQALADLVAGQLPALEPVTQHGGLPRVQFLARGDPARDRESMLESLRRDIPCDGIAEVLVDGISWRPAEATLRTTTAM